MLKRQQNGSERVTTKAETMAKIASNPYKRRQTNIKITKLNEMDAKIHQYTKNTTDGSRSRRVGILMLSPPWLNGL